VQAAREGLRQAVRRRRAERDREAYLAHPEIVVDDGTLDEVCRAMAIALGCEGN
jgi:hypothetical protein